MSYYSKTLIWLLRHRAVDEGFNMDEEGYIKVNDLLFYPKLKGIDKNYIHDMTKRDKKNRFTLVGEGIEMKIKANYGHSGTVFSLMTEKKQNLSIDVNLNIVIHCDI